jgi:membrane protein DedA with SNARE-associated domain
MVGYVIGREFGYWLLLRYGFYLRITESRIKLGEYLFLRHGGKIVVVGRFVPVLRSIAGILAGANHMPWQFLLGNALGALAWASIFGFAAYILGRQVERVAGPMVIAIGVVALILIVIAVIFVGPREAQLMAEAERALPGPLKNRRDRPGAGE